MKVWVALCVSLVAMVLASSATARADTYYCSVHVEEYGRTSKPGVYEVRLTSHSDAQQSVHVVFVTNSGWFAAPVTGAVIQPYEQTWRTSFGAFTDKQYAYAPMFVRLPLDATVQHAYVANAGGQSCPDRPEGDANVISRSSAARYTQGPAGDLHLTDPLSVNDPLPTAPAAAVPIAAPDTGGCKPYANAQVARLTMPDESGAFMGSGEVFVKVAISATGHVDDAWIWGSSGSPAIDRYGLLIAKDAQYVPAQSYCAAVPSNYVFRVERAP